MHVFLGLQFSWKHENHSFVIQMHNELDNQNIKFDNNNKCILQCFIFQFYIEVMFQNFQHKMKEKKNYLKFSYNL